MHLETKMIIKFIIKEMMLKINQKKSISLKKIVVLIFAVFYCFRINAQCSDEQTPFKTLNIPGIIEAEDFDLGCPGDAYSDKDDINNGGIYRTTQVDIQPTTDAGGGYNVGWMNTGEWLEYTVNVASSGNYSFNMRIASTSTDNKFHIEFDGVDKTGPIIPPNTGDFQTWVSVIKTINLEAGKHIMCVFIEKAADGLNLNKFDVTSDDVVWNFDTSLESWVLTSQLKSNFSNGILSLTITGADPFMHSPDNLNVLAVTHRQIKIRMKNNTAATSGTIYFITNNNTNFSEDKRVEFPVIANDAVFTEYTLEMNMNAQWTGTIKQIRFDPLGTATSGTVDLDYIKIIGSVCTQQSIIFNKIDKKLISDGPFELKATASSGLPIEFKVVSGPATLDGNTVTLKGTPGLVIIAANQPGDAANCPADEVRQSFFVELSGSSTETEQLKAYGDSWVATDAIGRVLPGYEDCGDYRPKKYVGMFYWLWHASIRIKSGPIQTAHDLLVLDPYSPAFECADYYWGEPEDGFYHPSDPWSTRRNLQLLANAGIDFVFLDFTNGDQGNLSLENFMTVVLDMYNKGIPVPKLSFFMNENYNAAMTSVMDKIYNHPEYDPLLFKWKGKPLLMADSTKCALQCTLCQDQAIKDHFTWRKTWAFDAGQWNFLDTYPQDYCSFEGKPEQMPVCKAMGAPMWEKGNGQGSSFHNSKSPEYNKYWETYQSKYGFAFEEQWTRAHSIDPSILCITGWNELTAGAWPSRGDKDAIPFMGKAWNDPSWRCVNNATCLSKDANGNHIPHGWYFVDEFNQEFNRDIEPMKGGYTDNYYYQLVSHTRKFKGMSAPEPISACKTIAIDGNFNEWTTVTPVFKDAPGDVSIRNYKNVNNSAVLTNNTARNDIIESRATYDENNIYFYVKAAQNLTPHTDPNWMLLFIDVDRNKGTGWEGYDYVVNYSVKSSTETTLKQWNGKNWGNEKLISYAVNGDALELSIPRSAVMLDKGTPEFYFHWADNPQQLKDITSFFTDGDSAPDRRFNYNFSTSKIAAVPITELNKVSIYPNPATNQVTLNSNNFKVDEITIFDLLGHVFLINNETFIGTKTFNLSLEKGIYLIKLKGNNHLATQKLIVK